jgi:hypothetical protein
LETPDFTLTAGRHRIRLEVDNLAYKNRITVCQQLPLLREGEEEPGWIDLKNSMEFYHSYMGGWPVPEEALTVSKPHAGGKPVFYTEANSQYKGSSGPWHFSKASALREMLGVGCLYHVFLQHGVPLVNYWFLYEERNGIGILEGVAHDDAANERGRLDPHRRPVFHLLKAYRQNAFDWLVATDVLDAPRFLTGIETGITVGYAQKTFDLPYVQALATLSEAGDDLSLFVINVHPEEDISARVEIAGFQKKSRCKVLTVTGASPGTNNEPEDCPSGDCVRTTEKGMDLPRGGFAYRFPKHSLTVLVFHKAGSDQNPPRNPTGLSGSAGDGKAMLYWDANREQDLDGYFIYRSRSPEGPFRHRVNDFPVLANEYLDIGLGNDVTYTYAVRAVDLHGNESPFSNKVRLTPREGGGDPDDPPVGSGDETPPSPPILLDVL